LTASRGDDYLATGGPGHGGGEEDAVTGLAVEEDAALLGVGGQHDTRLRVEHYGESSGPGAQVKYLVGPSPGQTDRHGRVAARGGVAGCLRAL